MIKVSVYPTNEPKRGYNAKLVSSGMWQGPRAAACHVWAERRPTVCEYVCVCVATFRLICGPNVSRHAARPRPKFNFTAEKTRRLEHGDRSVGGRGRKQRKCGAGSSTDVCGHSLHGLLTRKGQANNTRQQSSQSEQ